jgi:hypothetical protein
MGNVRQSLMTTASKRQGRSNSVPERCLKAHSHAAEDQPRRTLRDVAHRGGRAPTVGTRSAAVAQARAARPSLLRRHTRLAARGRAAGTRRLGLLAELVRAYARAIGTGQLAPVRHDRHPQVRHRHRRAPPHRPPPDLTAAAQPVLPRAARGARRAQAGGALRRRHLGHDPRDAHVYVTAWQGTAGERFEQAMRELTQSAPPTG